MHSDPSSGGHDARAVPPAPPFVGRRPSTNGSSTPDPGALPPVISGRAPSGLPLEDEEDGESAAFPLDAFFIPEDTERVPMGMDPRPSGAGPRGRPRRQWAASEYRPEAVASRLEELATGLRTGGASAAALWATDPDPLRRALGEALGRFFTPADR